MQLSRVVERQGVHLDIVGGHLAVDGAGDVLRDQAAAREHGALGPRLGAAGVEQLQRIVVANVDVRLRRVGMRRPLAEVLPARFGRPEAGPQRHRVARRGAGERLVGHAGQGRLDQHAGRAGVLDDVGHLVRLEHEVDRNRQRPQLGQREVGHDEGVGVVREDRDPVALAHTTFGHRVRRAVDRLVQLGERLPHLAVDDRELVGQAQGAAPQQVAERVAAGGLDVAREALVGGVHRLEDHRARATVASARTGVCDIPTIGGPPKSSTRIAPGSECT